MLSNRRFILSQPLLIFKWGSFEPLEPPFLRAWTVSVFGVDNVECTDFREI